MLLTAIFTLMTASAMPYYDKSPKADKAARQQERKALKQMRQDMETVKDKVKQGKELDKMEALVRKHLSDSANHDNLDLRLLLTDVLKKAYEIGNEKAYLREKLDTTCLMLTGRRLFLACESLDSLDMQPNSKGVSAPSYRKKNADYLMPYRKNLLSGALFFYEKAQWEDAWQNAQAYLGCRKQPLFSVHTLDSQQDAYAAYLAFMTAYNQKNLSRMEEVSEEAMTYGDSTGTTSRSKVGQMVLQLLSEVSLKDLNASKYIGYIKRGFENDPHSNYFFPRVIDYYVAQNQLDEALKYAVEAMESDSTNTLFLLARHSVLMSMKRYDDALRYGLQLLGMDDSVPEPNYNCGVIYYQKALKALKQRGKTLRQRTMEAQELFRQCLPYMERFRKLSPKDKVLWKPVLYDVYLNLNMGQEFAEIEKL